MSKTEFRPDRQTLVVVGHGMVGLRFCEKMVEYDVAKQFRIITFCEEPRAAYDRVGLTSFFTHRNSESLMQARRDWYHQNGIEIHIGDRVSEIDHKLKIVRSDRFIGIKYDYVVLATGSYPFVPPIPGIKKKGVFVYRTVDDLDRITDYAKHLKTAAVIGGGLRGLEAAQAACELGLKTHIIEFAPRLLSKQIDDAGSRILVQRIEDLGVRVRLNTKITEIHGTRRVERMEFSDGESLNVDMIIVSAGIQPRDELARESGLEVAARGGVVVNDRLVTSAPEIFAIGEVTRHAGTVYGLVAPGYEMAEVAARNLCGGEQQFSGTDVSTNLKLMGVDVASFGDYEADAQTVVPVTFEDPVSGTYKKLLFNQSGTQLIGGLLIGDASEYASLSIMANAKTPLSRKPQELILRTDAAGTSQGGIGEIPDDSQISSYHNVLKPNIGRKIKNRDLPTVRQIK
ncbi:MAG: FAD-dependent oxidoreductase [Fuerstiella sp.]|nr:FAD-dependent oxidoreductase [Fuerstiella sp.]